MKEPKMTAEDRQAVDDFNAAVEAERELNPKLSRTDASCLVAKKQPALHKGFLVATNRNPVQRRILGVV